MPILNLEEEHIMIISSSVEKKSYSERIEEGERTMKRIDKRIQTIENLSKLSQPQEAELKRLIKTRQILIKRISQWLLIKEMQEVDKKIGDNISKGIRTPDARLELEELNEMFDSICKTFK